VPNAELLVSIIGNVTITCNDFSSGAPGYLLHNTPELLSTLTTRQTKAAKQGAHGIVDSLTFYDDRPLPFDGEIIGTSQGDRKSKEEALKQCLALATFQSFAGNDGYFLVQFTDEDATLKQCYAKVVSPPKFGLIDNTDPTRRTFEFVMMAKDPNIYSQTLQSGSGTETYQGTNFQVVQGSAPTVPFQLYQYTAPSLTCVNGGTKDAPPVITINGPTTSPVVKNTTTGIFMDLSASGGLTLLAGEKVVIDVSAYSIMKTDVGGVVTNASGYLTAASNWISLIAGSNAFTLLDSSPTTIAATITIQWRNTYI
jgi:hypothetical protein